ncbi:MULTISPECIES: trifunctional transcriptional regulator/proline dehydrogenase/L-glutamate gamma-semialdehyde dehydrogenase [unclassified Methylobacterium]|uniref:trifunctional transcriptional regulator/proline dehydrogenase/L-glutamate gamma-semialdehyde dehydrogenase n=1 Tax=unclassified Methylobacterium TaxID=2615210 RepID=UPI0011C1DA30|nr:MULTISPECIES: trifunctional transcriptional regulator/proline dehydrogenase/L-glutamate gamma-semialdehyde dehydrogenase [unclassified Methylobacterium]QEE42531.1 trifunctional transcriptional regulator/proline dehydrogenase/L-glutamate gamma-semialdehyde dehydrogenase [Methylobacterium sp. WL1]TXN58121.1 trifunctional transcriptional regulator/proline dehydrogenase/L-glutamate gamma-semialdehyde dehydrogenase [Methylobacterium sp. WL2]
MPESGVLHRPAVPTDDPFTAFADDVVSLSPLRAAMVAACRRPEPDCVAPLLDLARLPPDAAGRVANIARRLVEGLRRNTRRGGVEGLIHEYALSSQEGVALMCLAEALLRIPDAATRDALIRDKIAGGDWAAHLGHSPSPFVNAATWGLLVTGRLTATRSESGLSATLTRLIARGGEPLIRKAVDLAMRLMGEQFVTGRDIGEALRNAAQVEARGFTYSYDMLGEAALTAEDADRYLSAYQEAIRAIGDASAGRGVLLGPGISIKLSALHPRYTRSQRGRVMAELAPRIRDLARLAKRYEIGLNIDAKEADRLDLSLDILETLVFDPGLAGWDGLGFVVQAYGKRCPFAIDVLIDLARRSRRRLMVRLVKGAYWDSEIKRAQVDGLADFPVFTRKLHTDVSYLACARKLLAAPEAIFPQFATHNAQTLASIVEMAGPDFRLGRYEFQCLHGMGEPLYEAVVGGADLDRPCRIYAPVGTHETLLAYLVRRLLENGANSSFVNRVGDVSVPVDALIADPVAAVAAMPVPGAPHERIALPRDLYGLSRANAAGLDLADEAVLGRLAAALAESGRTPWRAVPSGADPASADTPVHNPADHRDVVGTVRAASVPAIEAALARAEAAAETWAAVETETRSARLRTAADAFEARMPVLIGLIVREAGKSSANAVAEIREAVDFLRYYAAEAERTLTGPHAPLGPVVCIAPWNFPLAIFVGQVAAALAAGNPVLAKPAAETPLTAWEAIRLLHGAGIPEDALQILPGAGDVGAALVGDARVQGVMFTGSTGIAKTIQGRLAERLGCDGEPIPLVAETGGQNAMVVDSSALAEQVVADVIASAFDSAGQRCSALRILCLQEEIADRTVDMLRSAMRELVVGDPRRLAVDVGPVITQAAAERLNKHVETMRGRGFAIHQVSLPAETANGTFVPPTLIEITRVADVEHEVFGPVLHVLRYARHDLGRLLDEIDATGYGLTFGLQTRIDETADRILDRVGAGNRYVNRNVIGAVVGVQPFGGSGLFGTGPKAGGPLYLGRLLKRPPASALDGLEGSGDLGRRYAAWLRVRGFGPLADTVAALPPIQGAEIALAGPVGERNLYALRPRGRVAAIAETERGLILQLGAIIATGNRAVVLSPDRIFAILAELPAELAARVERAADLRQAGEVRAVLYEGGPEGLQALNRAIAHRPGPILQVQARAIDALAAGDLYALPGLIEERSTAINTTAAGGNASLLAIG